MATSLTSGSKPRGRAQTIAPIALLLALTACSTLPSRRGGIDPSSPDEKSQATRTKREPHLSPENSHSRGEEGGLVILYPRIVPKESDPTIDEIASLVQARLRALAERAKPGVAIDVRPAPERVCPREGGCVAPALGAVVARKGQGCAVAATVGPSGTTPIAILPWAGKIDTKTPTVAFRDPPESALVIQEWTSCDALLASLRENTPPSDESALLDAIRAAK